MMSLSRLVPSAVAFGALTLLGCSDPVPPPAEGGVFFRVFSGTTRPAGTSCGRTTAGDGARIPGDDPPRVKGITGSFDDSPGTPVVDGQNGARVSCTVAGGGTFRVSGRLAFGAVSFAISGATVPKEGDGVANVIATYDPSATNMANRSGEACTVRAHNGQVQPGAIWGTFDCPDYYDSSAPSTSACAATGVFLLQNCEQ